MCKMACYHGVGGYRVLLWTQVNSSAISNGITLMRYMSNILGRGWKYHQMRLAATCA